MDELLNQITGRANAITYISGSPLIYSQQVQDLHNILLNKIPELRKAGVFRGHLDVGQIYSLAKEMIDAFYNGESHAVWKLVNGGKYL